MKTCTNMTQINCKETYCKLAGHAGVATDKGLREHAGGQTRTPMLGLTAAAKPKIADHTREIQSMRSLPWLSSACKHD